MSDSLVDSQVETVVVQPNNVLKISGIKAWIAATPARLFWVFAISHLLVWTIVPTFINPNAPLDVIEGYAWGHEWLIGTHKHPPMQAWWLGVLAIITGRAAWAHFLASQVAVIVAFWAVWQTGRRMFNEQAALLGTLLLEGVVYYNFISPEFNPNVLQLPFWALTGLFFHRAIKDGRTRDWLLFGIWGACSLYTKYSSLLLLISLLLLMLARPEGRRRLAQPGPYIAVLTMLALFVPHLVWLFDNAFLPFTYAWDRMHDDANSGFVISSIRAPAFYIISQLLALLPATLLFFAFFDQGTLSQDKQLRSFDRDFLDFVTFGPFVLTLVMAIFIGIKIHDMWAMPFWNFVGLWAISRFKAEFSQHSVRRFTCGWAIISIGLLVAYIGTNVLLPYTTHRGQRGQFPGQALAAQVDAAWHERFTSPLRYVIGDVWPAGNVAYYSPEWPHVLLKGDYRISPWVNPDNVKKYGGLVVWCLQNCSYKNREYEETQPEFIKNFPQAEIQPPITLPRQTDAIVPPAKIGWAIIAPESATQR